MRCKNKKVQVDHQNRNGLDNRRNNISLVNNQQNSINRNMNKNNKTGIRNVCFFDNQYIIQLQINGKNKVLGKTKDLEEAGRIAKKMREKYYGELK